jgi:hypothetical protein
MRDGYEDDQGRRSHQERDQQLFEVIEHPIDHEKPPIA